MFSSFDFLLLLAWLSVSVSVVVSVSVSDKSPMTIKLDKKDENCKLAFQPKKRSSSVSENWRKFFF